jgi:hypothetical protein
MLATQNIILATAIKIPVSPYWAGVKPPSRVNKYVLKNPIAKPMYTTIDEIILCFRICDIALFAAKLIYLICFLSFIDNLFLSNGCGKIGTSDLAI